MSATDSLAEVEVLGLTEDILEDYLTLYFENRRRSGGGPVVSCTKNGSVALLTFSTPQDAEKVLSKPEHEILHRRVQVRRPPPWDLKKVALCGLDPGTPVSLLEMYVENLSGCEPGSFSIFYSADKTTALVTFQEEMGEEELQSMITNVEHKKLHQRSITAQRVRVCGDVLVENCSNPITSELLVMYFENRRSGGGDVRSVTMLNNGSAAVVSFLDWNVTTRVLNRSHSLHNCKLSVSPYYPTLLGSPSGDAPEDKEMEEVGTTDTWSAEQSCEQVPEVPEHVRDKLPFQGKDKNCVMEVGHTIEMTPGDTSGQIEVQMENSEVQQVKSKGWQMRPLIYPGALTSNTNEPETSTLSMSRSSDTHKDLYPCPPDQMSPQVDVERRTPVKPSHNVQEREVVMEAAELLFLQRYHHELLAGMDAVTILPLDEKDACGFKVAGDAFSCRTAVELLQHIMSSLASRTVTLEYPWVAHFLLESEGQRTLQETEEQYQCIIDTSQISWKVLDCVSIDPWSFVNTVNSTKLSPDQPMGEEESESEPDEDPLLKANIEDIKKIATLLKQVDSEKKDDDIFAAENPSSSIWNIKLSDSKEDLITDEAGKDDEAISEPKDDELDKVCQMSRMEYQDQQLDEEAQMLLAIQRSMEVTSTAKTDEDEELRKALELSLRQLETEEMEESLQRALEMSLQDQWSYSYSEGAGASEMPSTSRGLEASSDFARVRVLSGDETNLVVACAALRKAVTSRLDLISIEGIGDVQNLSEILAALEKKHKVKITTIGRQLQIQGFLDSPSQCRQELCKILDALQVEDQVQTEMMNLDAKRDLEMIDVPENSEEYNRVIQPFIKDLESRRLSITVFKLQKVHNPLLYNQYQLKKQRMTMNDPNKPVEQILYHGTSESSTKEICLSGFNRSFCGKNATMYGQGVYFALLPELSARDNYSPLNKDGKKFVFVARVLTGEYTIGKESMRTPPLMPQAAGDIPKRYDSLVNCMPGPTIFVIFNDTQAYPQYLITCSKCTDMGPKART